MRSLELWRAQHAEKQADSARRLAHVGTEGQQIEAWVKVASHMESAAYHYTRAGETERSESAVAVAQDAWGRMRTLFARWLGQNEVRTEEERS